MAEGRPEFIRYIVSFKSWRMEYPLPQVALFPR